MGLSSIVGGLGWAMGRLSRGVRVSAGALAVVAGLWLAPAGAALGAGQAGQQSAAKVLRLPIRTDGPKSLDPAEGSTLYENLACAQIMEPLLTFSYASPGTLEPLLLTKLPESADGGKTWQFELKEGVRFHDHEVFPGGKGRAVTPRDVFYTLRRLADPRYRYKNYWLIDGVIEGMNQYRDAQARLVAEGKPFDYDAPIEGFEEIDERRFRIVLTKPVYKFLYTLAQFQTSIVPREAVERYGDRFSFNPVGTGPFVLESWTPKQSLSLTKNPSYHPVAYPAREAWGRDDRRRRLDRPAGQMVPFVDRVEFTMYAQEQPMWLQFQAGKLGYTEVPGSFYEQAFDKRTRQLKPETVGRGITDHREVLLDFIFQGINMEDPVIGGYTPERRALRQALQLAVDFNELNEANYNGINIIYDGPIPFGLDGFPPEGRAPKSYRGPDLPGAQQKLAEAGWPGGRNARNEQLTIRYFTNVSQENQQLAELLKRQYQAVGVNFEPVFVDFSTLIENINNKKAQMFGFAWGSDYPDAENNLALFYGPNQSPGSNHYNYKNPAYDELYERILVMPPSPERTKLYEQMRDTLIEDVPYVGSMGRTRFYLIAPWLLNCRPTERTFSWIKYLDVDPSKQ